MIISTYKHKSPPFEDQVPTEEVSAVQVKTGTPLTPAVYPSEQVYVIVEPMVLVKVGALSVFDGCIGLLEQ